jgi:ketosteroid isomerase-like protein
VSRVDYAQRVRRMWSAFTRDGIEAVRPYVDDDIEFTPSNDVGPLRGFAAIAEYWEANASSQSLVAHAVEQHGDCVLVHGSLRIFRDGGFVDTQPTWVYFFRDERLQRAVAFASREDALAAIAAHAEQD